MNPSPKSLDSLMLEVAKEVGVYKGTVKKVIDILFDQIREELKRPTRQGILLSEFATIQPRAKSIAAYLKRREGCMNPEDVKFWTDYLHSLKPIKRNEFKIHKP